jgi:four helix bundle protein
MRDLRELEGEEMNGLTSQIRRASTSIALTSLKDAAGMATPNSQVLPTAMGSATELEYHLLLAHDLELLADSEHVQFSADMTEEENAYCFYPSTER